MAFHRLFRPLWTVLSIAAIGQAALACGVSRVFTDAGLQDADAGASPSDAGPSGDGAPTCNPGNEFAVLGLDEASVIQCDKDIDASLHGVQVRIAITNPRPGRISIGGTAIFFDAGAQINRDAAQRFSQVGSATFTIHSGTVRIMNGDADPCERLLKIEVTASDCAIDGGG